MAVVLGAAWTGGPVWASGTAWPRDCVHLNETNDDSGEDIKFNDGCPAFGAKETICNETSCTGLSCDDDSDGYPNDGCPAAGEAESEDTTGPICSGTTCIHLTVNCDSSITDVGEREVRVRKSVPSGAVIGDVILTTGSNGVALYGTPPVSGPAVRQGTVDELNTAGYNTYEIQWFAPPDGYLTNSHGAGTQATFCGVRTLLEWLRHWHFVRDCADFEDDDSDGFFNDGCPAFPDFGDEETICNESSCSGGSCDDDSDGFPNDGCDKEGFVTEEDPLCGAGNSGGAMQLATALTYYNIDRQDVPGGMTAVVYSGGPSFPQVREACFDAPYDPTTLDSAPSLDLGIPPYLDQRYNMDVLMGWYDANQAKGAERAMACTDNLDNDGDGSVNDGCPQVGPKPELNCSTPAVPCTNCDNDGDGFPNDGCVQVGGNSEAFYLCLGTGDDDGDGTANDGCPGTPGDTFSESGAQCVDAPLTDDDNDGFWNEGCPLVEGANWCANYADTGRIATTGKQPGSGELTYADNTSLVSTPGDYNTDAAQLFVLAERDTSGAHNRAVAYFNLLTGPTTQWVDVPSSESGAECGTDAIDDDSDGYFNDGCPANPGPGDHETICDEPSCSGGSCDDDSDGYPNDGCPTVGEHEVDATQEGADEIVDFLLEYCVP